MPRWGSPESRLPRCVARAGHPLVKRFTKFGRFMSVTGVQERTIDVEGLRTRYLTAGDDGGPPLVLLHGVGTSAGEWSWVLPGLALNHRVYAVDLPGYDGSYEPPDYAPASTATFIGSFLVRKSLVL